ncbi:MAG: sigma 54-dependent Fis family transcriptional regulator [Deltaproteobacteria bacterium]|nr:sigma 54-dependent Fis family transcriptional regulator [Deltaproteobacteria bacterium]
MSNRRDDETRILAPRDGGTERRYRRKLKLEVVAGPDAGRSLPVQERVLHLGTQPGNTLQLSDDTVSRIHLEVRATAEGLRLRDLGSSNGTWVGGVRVLEAIVQPGAVVTLGNSQVRLDTLDEQVAESLSPRHGFGELVGQTDAMRAIFSLLERVAPTDETVLITGETGTGKELCARSIVAASPRRDRPLVIVDCGAIPPNLLESELFGHAKGAFTSAVSDYKGAFERANGGTIFLDEIGELPLEFQTRLLRAVENRSIRRVGDSREIPLDIRILAATNRCLEAEVNRGTFRADLYYRLSVVRINLPALRERPDDLEAIARHLMRELRLDGGAELDAEQLEQLKRHTWPGNVRELRNYLRRVALGDVVHAAAVNAAVVAREPDAPPVDLSLSFKDAKEAAIESFERAYLEALLKETRGNISQAARVAQTDRTYLSRLLSKYQIRG